MDNLRKVLLVNDDPAVGKSLDEALSSKGIAVVAVPTGEEALWQLENGSFDAVLSSMALRGMSGLEMTEEARERQPGLPVFILASGPGPAGERHAGVAGYLQLPLSPDQLADVADRVLSATAAAAQPRESDIPQPAARSESRLRDVVLFLLAPLIALGYIVLFPVVGLGMLVYASFEKKPATEEAEPLPAAGTPKPSLLKTIATMIAVAAVGIFYGLVAPFMGVVLVVWFGLEAWGKVGARAIGPGRN